MDIGKHLSDNMNRPRCPGLQFNDLASLAAGVKSLVYTSVRGAGDARLLDRLCADLKLKKVDLGNNKNVGNVPITCVLIGRSAKKLEAAKKAYRNVLSLEWGIALDYPECCVRSYIEWNLRRGNEDLIRHIYARSPAGTTFPFWMNNVFNYYSRLIRPEDRLKYAAFSKLNQGMDRESIIPWHPCSYLCAETVKKGKLIYDVMKRYMPLTAASRKTMLSKPIVFWDKFLFAILNGRCRTMDGGFIIAYKGLGGPKSLIGRETEKILSGRKTLRVRRGEITAPAGLRLPGNHIVIPFAHRDIRFPAQHQDFEKARVGGPAGKDNKMLSDNILSYPARGFLQHLAGVERSDTIQLYPTGGGRNLFLPQTPSCPKVTPPEERLKDKG
ncbi:MAG: DUF483 domain-containing protein [Elusimicrobia bacterium]|nr:DUF483 domain-containing protein [Elusimicrobiota bacterium]